MRSFTKFTNFFNAIASKFSLQKQNKSYSQIFNDVSYVYINEMSKEVLLEYGFLHNKLQLAATSKNLITRVLKNKL